ncbi:hypothetical protein AVEN_269086-1, partial [Araneus ventricosus]
GRDAFTSDAEENTQKCRIWRTTSPSCACSSTVILCILITVLYGVILLLISPCSLFLRGEPSSLP